VTWFTAARCCCGGDATIGVIGAIGALAKAPFVVEPSQAHGCCCGGDDAIGVIGAIGALAKAPFVVEASQVYDCCSAVVGGDVQCVVDGASVVTEAIGAIGALAKVFFAVETSELQDLRRGAGVRVIAFGDPAGDQAFDGACMIGIIAMDPDGDRADCIGVLDSESAGFDCDVGGGASSASGITAFAVETELKISLLRVAFGVFGMSSFFRISNMSCHRRLSSAMRSSRSFLYEVSKKPTVRSMHSVRVWASCSVLWVSIDCVLSASST